MAALTEEHDQELTEAVSRALVQGDTRLKAIREWRGLTQRDLAKRAHLDQGYPSELEYG